MSIDSENKLDSQNATGREATLEGKEGGHETEHGTPKSLRAFETEVERRSRSGRPTTEQQELDKGPEQIPEPVPGGPHRPSWKTAPEPAEAEKATAKGEGDLSGTDGNKAETAPKLDKKHLVPGAVLAGVDEAIARSVAESESRIRRRELRPIDDWRVLKGDAGEGRTYVDLLSRYDPERILRQPRFKDLDMDRRPDFAISSARDSSKLTEIVDSKAWHLMRPRDGQGNPASYDEFFRYLQQRPEAGRLLNTRELQNVVEKYASSPRLESEGKVVLYFPEDVIRYAPQVKQEIEGWSMTSAVHGHIVEVRSMGVWQEELQRDIAERLRQQRKRGP